MNRHDPDMIRNAVIHLAGEQPLQADLFDRPASGDVGLVCTNVRDMTGKRPVFIDDSRSVFLFPYHQIRFLEILPGSDGPPGLEAGSAESRGLAARRQGLAPPDQAPAAETAPDVAEPDTELEIDEDFLRRIREV
jgi:hypothetical protein